MAFSLNRERWVLLTALAVMVLLCWLYLLKLAADMGQMSMASLQASVSEPVPWGAEDVVLMLIMWIVMMVAMMLPSALPMILAFLRVNQGRQATHSHVVPSYIFVAGYVLVWTAYSVGATLLQWLLHEQALMSPQMATSGPYLASAIFIGAGVFQLTPLKQACLRHCRSPLTFLMSEWRDGYAGALVMGLRHGSYCVGCCWILMLLLFVTGVMNLLAVALMAAFVLAEKLLPSGEHLARISGLVLILVGLSWLF